MMGQEIVTGIIVGVGIFIITGVLIAVKKMFKRSIGDLDNRVKAVILCNIAMMDGMKKLGVNGDVKKRFDALIEQLTED